MWVELNVAASLIWDVKVRVVLRFISELHSGRSIVGGSLMLVIVLLFDLGGISFVSVRTGLASLGFFFVPAIDSFLNILPVELLGFLLLRFSLQELCMLAVLEVLILLVVFLYGKRV